ncbi:hypothetical protein PIB30_068735 [Stylosanthes scabra]|uniref:Uncharacterized protein n=1 Tax=Stylosanthes scabra TaxID=79078 RepID=A0ABU6QQ48_9FABA|nr:hypothetical protein [Stylosanthes scabra]
MKHSFVDPGADQELPPPTKMLKMVGGKEKPVATGVVAPNMVELKERSLGVFKALKVLLSTTFAGACVLQLKLMEAESSLENPSLANQVKKVRL